MGTQILKMFAASTGGTENALAQMDIPENGDLLGLDWSVNADLDADGETITVELSFLSVNQATTNDARGTLSVCSSKISLTTSGIANTGINKYVALGDGVPVAGGERLWLHAVASAGVAASITVLIHFAPLSNVVTRRSARRR